MVPYNHQPRVKGEQMENKDGKQVEIEVLIATTSNDWKREPLPQRTGERNIVWPRHERGEDVEEYGFGPGFAW
jgi:hypothetical protein